MLALTGWLAWRLLTGPLGLPFVAGKIEAAIVDLDPLGSRASIGFVGVELGDNLNPDFIVRDIRIESVGAIVLSINELRIAARWSTLTRGRIQVEGIEADRVLVSKIGTDSPLPPFDLIAGFIRRAVEQNGLRFAEVRSFGFSFEPPGVTPVSVVSNATLTASVREPGALQIQAITLGNGGAISVRLDADLTPADGSVRLHGETRGFDLADIAAAAGRDDLALSGSLSAGLSAVIDPARGVREADWQVVLGPSLQLNGRELVEVATPVRLDFSWDPDSHAVSLNPSTVVLPTGHLIAFGDLNPPTAQQPLWTYELQLNGQDVLSGIRTSEGRLAGTYDPAESLFVVDDMHIEGAGISFTAAARLSHRDGNTFGVLSGVSPRLPVAAVKALWPASFVPDVRDWIGKYISAGVMTNTAIDLSLQAGSADGVPDTTISFDFSKGDFTPFDGAPLIRDASGHATLSGGRFELVVDDGWADLADGRRLDVEPSSFVVADVNPEVPDAEVKVAFKGTAAAGVDLWNMLDLSTGTGFSATPEDAVGNIDAAISLALPLADEIQPSDIRFGGRINLNDFGLKAPLAGRVINNADIAIDLAGAEAHLRGKASIDGSPADLFLTLPISGSGASKSVVRLELDAAGRKAYGLDFGNMLGGKIGVEVTESGPSRSVVVDLAKATVNIPLIGYRKPAGRPGKLTFDLAERPNGTSITGLSLRAGPVTVEGQIALDKDRRFLSANLPKFNLSPDDQMSLKASASGDSYKVTVSGNRFDARPLVRGLLRQSTSSGLVGGASFDLSASIDSVVGEYDERVDGLNLSASLAAGRLSVLSLSVQTAGGGSTSVTLEPQKGTRRLTAEASEVGRLLRFTGIYQRVFGGRATLNGSVGDSGVLTARVDGNRWKVVEEPALARLSTASKSGPTEGLSTADISRLVLDLKLGGGMLTLSEGFIRTETAGLTMSGDVDFTKNALRLAGSYLPANQLDGFLAAIPLLGQTVFAGGGRSGLFGVSYRLSGPIDAPALTVNPLSAIAPGIFRRLFELK